MHSTTPVGSWDSTRCGGRGSVGRRIGCMSHSIRAIIGKPSVAEALGARFDSVRRVPLSQGYEMVPLLDRLFDAMAFSVEAANPEAAVGGWSRLGEQVGNVLAELSRISPVAYVYTEYFGGVGEQSAVAFTEGRLATRHGGADRILPWSSSIGPINAALAAIGVVRERGKDEFDSIGLGRHRSTDEWAADE